VLLPAPSVERSDLAYGRLSGLEFAFSGYQRDGSDIACPS